MAYSEEKDTGNWNVNILYNSGFQETIPLELEGTIEEQEQKVKEMTKYIESVYKSTSLAYFRLSHKKSLYVIKLTDTSRIQIEPIHKGMGLPYKS